MEHRKPEDIMMEERLRKSMEKEPVPDSLLPENIEKLLSRQKKPKRYWQKPLAMLCAAAILCVGTAAVISQWGEESGPVRKSEKRADISITAVENAEVFPEGLTVASDYEQVFDLLKRNYEVREYQEDVLTGDSEILQDGVASSGEIKNDSLQYGTTKIEYSDMVEDVHETSDEGYTRVDETQKDYSTTNIQVEGVQEADRMMTDGTYLYLLNQEEGKIFLVQPDVKKNTSSQIGEIQLSDESMQAQEMYLWDHHLVVVGSRYVKSQRIPLDKEELADSASKYGGGVQTESFVVTYDISVPEKPVKKGEVTIDGDYEASRLVDGHLYLFAHYGGFYGITDSGEGYDSCIPCVEGEKIKPEDIYIPEIKRADSFLVGSSVSLEQPDTVVDQFACMMYGTDFYITQEHIYLAQGNGEDTRIMKLSYKDGVMEAKASGQVKGQLNNSFSMDEYQGYLRLVTTSYDISQISMEAISKNNLFVLDEDLKQVGGIEDLAPGESIYSARFMGEVGYFVTYQQVDPLFSVDLSDPEHPQILGELKVSGFSEYLHPYGGNRLLGIGWETSSNGYGGVKQDGMKLSMFDTTDLANVKEIDKLVSEDVFDSEATYDHRAVLINVEKNLFGFGVEIEEKGVYQFRYRTYRYDEEQGFVPVTDTKLQVDNYDSVRGVYIGQMLYISDGKTLWTVSLEDGSLLDTLELG